jgi:GNAT superfamily N-acetyltransferase
MPVGIRVREPSDLDGCVDALGRVYATGGYPTNWPADPARWLSPSGLIKAWVASTDDIPVAGHALVSKLPDDVGKTGDGRPAVEFGRLFVAPAARRQGVAQVLIRHAKDWAEDHHMDLVLWVTDHLTAARTLYASTGFTLATTEVANWTAPDGSPVTVHRYDWPQDERCTPQNR